MQAISNFRAPAFRMPAINVNWTMLAFILIGALSLIAAMTGAQAAGTTGTALKPAFDALNDIVGGYGKQVLILVGFIACAFAVLASQATGAILKFIGFIIFLSVGLTAAVGLSGAVI